MGLLVLTDWKGKNYDLILVIVDRFIKMVHYKPMKITIDIPGFAKIIIDVVAWHHYLINSIITD